MQFETLTTPRLILRKLTGEVYDFVFNNYSENELREFLGADSDEKYLKEKEMQEKGRTMYNRGLVSFQLIEKKDQKIIGSCGFHNWYYLHFRSELGYVMVNEDYKNQGFMTEALKAVIEYGFKQMNLHRIEAFVAPFNVPSLKIMEKFQFTKEGFLRQHYFYEGKHEDSVVFGLLREDYLLEL